MAGRVVTNVVQLGDSATATQNLVIRTNVDGTFTIARGNFGATTQDIITIDANGGVGLLVSALNGGQLAGLRNVLINGGMVICQRWGASSISTVGNVTWTADRWRVIHEQADKLTVQIMSSDGSLSSPRYLRTTVKTPLTPVASGYYGLDNLIEADDFARFQWGFPSAKPITLSFKVRSSLTGKFSAAIRNIAGGARSVLANYTVNANAGAWEYKTITFPPDTGCPFMAGNGTGVRVFFDYGCGTNFDGTVGVNTDKDALRTADSVRFISQTANSYHDVSEVQLEGGTVATPFEWRSFQQELAMCQRYYCEVSVTPTAAGAYMYTALPVPMRAVPAIALKAGALAGATYGNAPYGTSAIRQLANASGASDALMAVSAEL